MHFHTVPVMTNLSAEAFFHEHVLAGQPVVLKGALTRWNALRWTPDSLKAKAGMRRIRYRTEAAPQTGAFGDLVDQIFRGDAPAPYLRNVDIAEQLPELIEDITPEVIYSRDNWRSHVLMPRGWPSAVKKHAYELFVSRANAAFPYLHVDYWGMSGFFAQICGEKQVILFPPEDAPNLYPRADEPLVSQIANFDAPADPRYPKLAAARQHRVTIGPGDLLFNPGWWHTTKTTRTAMTVIWAYWNRHEWTRLVAAVASAGGLRGRLLPPYLKFVGICNRIAGSWPRAATPE